jgi:hypothetical protein
MSARDPLPQIENSIQRRMVLILSGIIVGLVLLLGLPLVVISVNLQRQAAISEHQAITNRTAQNLSDIIRNLETGQLPMSTADSNNPAVASMANQLITLLNLTTSRVSAQIQDAIDQQESLEQLFSLNPQILGIKRFTPDGLTTQESYWQAEPLAANNIRPNASSQALVAQGITTQDAFIFDRN